MRIGGRRKSVVFFLTFGICLVVLALALNVGWILLNWREVALLVLGIVFFGLIITGLVLNTTFLVREIRRNEQHDAFINAVTHELKTPLASIRLYLETLKSRDVSEERRQEFYDIMLADGDRLLHTVEQVLHAGRGAQKKRALNLSIIDLGQLVRECLELARVRHGLDADAIRYVEAAEAAGAGVTGDRDELRAAVSNLLDNAVKYSDKGVSVEVEVAPLDERTSGRARDRQRHRHPPQPAQAHLQALLPRARPLHGALQGDGPRPLHRALHRRAPRRARLRRERRARARQHLHHPTPEGLK